jgi:hypothetical protein
LDGGDGLVEVTMVETGEKTKYRLTHINDDPPSYLIMYAVAFDLVVADAEQHHPRGDAGASAFADAFKDAN